MRKPTKNQSELNFWGVVTGIHGVSLASEAFRYHPQIVTQRFVALLDVVSNFAAFKICDQRVGNRRQATLCHSFSSITLRLKISGSVMLPARLEKQLLADSQLAPSVMEPTMRKFLMPLDGSGCDCLYVPVALIGGGPADFNRRQGLAYFRLFTQADHHSIFSPWLSQSLPRQR
jgi:hypothetical protein